MDNQWSLFGIDLSRVADIAKLALHQMLWGDEAGLRGKFYPAARLMNADVPTSPPYAKLIPGADQKDASQARALLFPADLALFKTIELPVGVEIDIDDALFYEISSLSPFPAEDTCSGWRVISRDVASLQVALAIASRNRVKTFVDEHVVSGIAPDDRIEVWTSSGDCLVQMDGFGEGTRQELYYQSLLGHGRKMMLLVAAACILMALPAAILAARSTQLQDVLVDTETEARAAASVRTSMVAIEDKVLVAREFFADRTIYDAWLNAIAEVTPESVYLTRLGLEGDRLTISGMAINAAEYQTTLASSGLVSDLRAPSAFTRDSRTGRERFTLTMRLADSK